VCNLLVCAEIVLGLDETEMKGGGRRDAEGRSLRIGSVCRKLGEDGRNEVNPGQGRRSKPLPAISTSKEAHESGTLLLFERVPSK
jgi:hypothetical protein